jgi:hypothetical protein
MPNSSAVARIKRSAIDRSALTSPGDETKTRIIFIAVLERRGLTNPALQRLAHPYPGSLLFRQRQFSQIATVSAKGIFCLVRLPAVGNVERCLASSFARPSEDKREADRSETLK